MSQENFNDILRGKAFSDTKIIAELQKNASTHAGVVKTIAKENSALKARVTALVKQNKESDAANVHLAGKIDTFAVVEAAIKNNPNGDCITIFNAVLTTRVKNNTERVTKALTTEHTAKVNALNTKVKTLAKKVEALTARLRVQGDNWIKRITPKVTTGTQ